VRRQFTTLMLGIGLFVCSLNNVVADQSNDGCREAEFIEICLKSLESLESIEKLTTEKNWWSSGYTSDYLQRNIVVVPATPTRRGKDGRASFNKSAVIYRISTIDWDDTKYLSCHIDILSLIHRGTATKCEATFPLINAYIPADASVKRNNDGIAWSYANGPWRVHGTAKNVGKHSHLYVHKYRLPEK